MIEFKNDTLLKDKPDYENYSENICKFSLEELKKEGILKDERSCANNKRCCSNNKECCLNNKKCCKIK